MIKDSPSQSSYSSDILYLITIWLTKCSVVFLTLRLSPDKRHNLASNVVLGAATLFLIISLFIVALGCDSSKPWLFINAQYGKDIVGHADHLVFKTLTASSSYDGRL